MSLTQYISYGIWSKILTNSLFMPHKTCRYGRDVSTVRALYVGNKVPSQFYFILHLRDSPETSYLTPCTHVV